MSVISDFFKFRSASGNESDQQIRQTDVFLQGGRRAGENENPYLSARRTWNDHMRGIQSSRTMWQLLALLCLLIALASVGGVIAIGSQSKFIPYVVQVNKLGEAIAVSRADIAGETDPRVVHASLASFINDLRMVTPDVALQRKAIFRAYAETQTVNVEIISVIPQSPETWQVDWLEKIYDRQGHLTEQPFKMRALLRIYNKPTTPSTTEEQIRNNPLGIYIQDFSWSKQT